MAERSSRAFVLRLGRALHAYGYPAHRLEGALAMVCRRLGLESQFFSTPTALFASFGPTDDQRTFQIRIAPGEVNLGKLTELDALIAAVDRGEVDTAEASRRVEAVVAAPVPYGAVLTTASFALASGAASRFFGGGWRELAAATAIGLVIGLLALTAGRSPVTARIFEPLAAVIAALLAIAAAHAAGPLSVYVATVAGLIVLIPGFPLTVAITELATQNLASGTARLAGAAATFLAIGFGVALGTRVGEQALGAPPAVLPVSLPPWTEWVALGVATLAFTVLLRAKPRDAPFIMASGAVAYGGARTGAQLLGPELGACLGALLVGAGSNLYARALHRPSAVPLVPGILLLVPGSLGFRSLSSLLERDTLLGVEAAFRMTLVAVALATGLLFANALVPPREWGGDSGS